MPGICCIADGQILNRIFLVLQHAGKSQERGECEGRCWYELGAPGLILVRSGL